MAGRSFFNTHYTWEDWLGIALGAAIVLSPLFANHSLTGTVMLSTMLVGVLVVAISALALVDLHRLGELAMLLFGAWLAASPSYFGYSSDTTLATVHMVLGLALMALAAIEYWQDRTRSDDSLAHHGR